MNGEVLNPPPATLHSPPGRSLLVLIGLGAVLGFGGAEPAPPPASRPAPVPAPRPQAEPGNDRTFRPTVVIRKGTGRGSGTLIASLDGEALVLTAAHVVEDPGTLLIEIHRYNLGLERRNVRVTWPLLVRAEIAARDPDSDLAILRIEGLPPLPYVGRLAPDVEEPAARSVLTAVGIDRATRLTGWSTEILGTIDLDFDRGGGERPFLLARGAPEFGRSGGGLFDSRGDLVGVCIARTVLDREKRGRDRGAGLYVPNHSIHRLLRRSRLDAVVVRSEAERRPAPRTAATPAPARRPITPTRARVPDPAR